MGSAWERGKGASYKFVSFFPRYDHMHVAKAPGIHFSSPNYSYLFLPRSSPPSPSPPLPLPPLYLLPISFQIFGWLATFIWFASIWFVYKDTVWHRDRTGPLASLYQKKAEETGEKPKDQAGQAGICSLPRDTIQQVCCVEEYFLEIHD